MKKFLLILIASIFLTSCGAQNSNITTEKDGKNFVGIGLLEVSMNIPLKIYANENDENAYDAISFGEVTTGEEKGRITFKTNVLKDKLKPYTLAGGTSEKESEELVNSGLGGFAPELIFTVLESAPSYFAVVLNEDTKEIGYIKSDDYIVYNSNEDYRKNYNKYYKTNPSSLIYETWESYLTRVEAVYGKGVFEVFDKPNGKSIFKGDAMAHLVTFKVTKLDNEWAKVEATRSYPDDPVIDGWIQWRTNNEVLIEIVEFYIF